MHPVAEGCVHVVVRFPDCGSVSQVERDTSDVGLVDYVGGSDLECDVEGALTAAAEIGYPVALKIGSADVVHKTDVGGVSLDLRNAAAVREAYDDMHATFGDGMHGAVVQRMAPAGLEVIVGVTQDLLFGPLLLFGLGGVTAELLADPRCESCP